MSTYYAYINIGIPCKHLFGSFTASAIRSQHRTFFNINKNSQQIIFYDLRCESLFRMYEFFMKYLINMFQLT